MVIISQGWQPCKYQTAQSVGACGPHHAPMWKHTQSSVPFRCVPTTSLRFHAAGCRVEIRILNSVQEEALNRRRIQNYEIYNS